MKIVQAEFGHKIKDNKTFKVAQYTVKISKAEWEKIGEDTGWNAIASKRKRPQPTSQPAQEKAKDTSLYRGKGGKKKESIPPSQTILDKKTKNRPGGKKERQQSKLDLKRPESE